MEGGTRRPNESAETRYINTGDAGPTLTTLSKTRDKVLPRFRNKSRRWGVAQMRGFQNSGGIWEYGERGRRRLNVELVGKKRQVRHQKATGRIR